MNGPSPASLTKAAEKVDPRLVFLRNIAWAKAQQKLRGQQEQPQ